MIIEDNQKQKNRISFGIIQLGTIRCLLSVKLENTKLSDFDIQAGNMVNIMQPIVNSFASLTDCRIGFKELIIMEGYVTEDMLYKTINNHYYYQF
jgi:hypothetical protein